MRYSKSILSNDWKGGENPFHHSRGVDCFLGDLLGMGSEDPSQTTTQTPYGEEQWDQFREGAQDWYEGPGAQLNPEAMTAPRTADQIDAQNFYSSHVMGPGFQNNVQSGQQGANNLMSNPYGGTNYSDLTSNPAQYGLTSANANPALQQQLSGDPFQNPALEDTIRSVQQGTMEDYQRNIAPLDRQNITYNQPGGSSRGSLIQARSQDDLMQNMANTRAGMTFQGYQQGLDRQDRGIANQMQNEQLGEFSRGSRANEGLNRYLGGVQGFGNINNTALQGAGGMDAFGAGERGFNQEMADEGTFRWDYGQNQDLRALEQYGGLLGQLPQGGTQTTTLSDGTSGGSQLMGLGLGIGSLLM
jgi:hypothetical protein